MIDIHSHILPGLDDGSQDMDKSIAMAELAVDCGVTDMIATPHCNQKRVFENYASPELEKCFEDFKNELKAAGIELNVYRGSEVFATEDIVQLYRDKRIMTLNDSRYMLVNIIATRARTIAQRAEDSGDHLNRKPVSTAIEEIAQGKITVIKEN